ncbi:MAG: domain, FtsQ-type [Chloroflexota bacterium]
MSDRDKRTRRTMSGARPFAPGEAPLGVRPGLGGQRRRAGADAGVRVLQRRGTDSAQNTPRAERRRRLRPETSALLRRIGVVLILATALVAPPALAASGRLVVDSVKITGLTLLDEQAISELAGISAGESLLGVDLHATERAVEAHPFVASARARIGIPGELRIEIREAPLLLRWQRGDETLLISGSGHLLGRVDSPLLSARGAAAAALLPLVVDETSVPFVGVGEEISAVDLDIVTRLASLTPEDVGSNAARLTIVRDSQYGYLLQGVGEGFTWNAVFGMYSATIRPVEMVPAQVRLLRSLLATREREIGWVILADGQAGTFTDPGVRPPPPPSPSASPSPALP